MGVTIDFARSTDPKATGTQDITASLGGLTPKAALTFMTHGKVDDTVVANCVFGISITDGTRSKWLSWISSDAHATIDSGSHNDENGCLVLPADGNPNGQDGLATFDSWITNGIRVDWTTNPGSKGHTYDTLLFAGTNLSAYVGSVTLGTQDTEINVTAPGFEPDIVFVLSSGRGLNAGVGNCAFGVVNNGASVEHVSWTHQAVDNVGTSDNRTILSTSYAGVHYANNDTGTATYSIELAGFDASGFSAYARGGDGSSTVFHYLALSFGGQLSAAVGTETTPTSTGTKATTGTGLTPSLLMVGPTWNSALNTNNLTTGISSGFGVSDGTTEYGRSASDKDNVGTSVSKGVQTSSVLVGFDPTDGTVETKATTSSLDSDGFTLNYSAVNATARYFWYLALGTAAGGSTITVTPGTLTLTGVAATVSNPKTVTVTAGSLTLTGVSATVSLGAITVSVTPGTLTLTGVSATVSNPKTVSVTPSALTLTGVSATVTNPKTVSVTSGTLTLAGVSATVANPKTITVTPGTLTLAGVAAVVSVPNPLAITVTPGTLTLTGIAAVIRSGADSADWALTDEAVHTWTLTDEAAHVWTIVDATRG